MLQRSTAKYVIALYLADVALTLASLVVARWLRIVIPFGKPLTVDGVALRWPMFVLAAIIWSLALGSFKAYDPHRLAQAADEVQIVVGAIAVSTLAFAGVLYFSYRGLSRLLYVYFFLLDMVLCLSARMVLRRLMSGWRSRRHRDVLVVGAGAVAQRLVRSLRPCEWMGIEVAGYLADDPARVGQMLESRPVLGTLDQAQEIIAERGIQEVVIALPMDAHHRVANLVAGLDQSSANIKVVPDYSELVFYRTTLEQLGDLFLVGLKEPVIGPIERLMKRAFDLVASALALLVLSPLLAVTALLVALTSDGPVFYHSLRVGEGGRTFRMRKFRTMHADADRQEDELISETSDGKLLFAKREDDPRTTPIGRFLRRHSLDELPQLFNVLVGEMSLVGPRPELPSLVERYEPWQRKRFAVPQGLTGWWQISGRANKPKYLHVEDDLYYLRNYSLLLDLRIIWRTLGAVLRGEGSF